MFEITTKEINFIKKNMKNLYTIAAIVVTLSLLTPSKTLISPAIDSDELRAQLLEEYFTEEGQTLSKEKIDEIMVKYFVKDLEHLEQAMKLQEPTEELPEADSDILGSYTVVVSFLKNNDLSDKSREDFDKKYLRAKTLIEFAHRNMEEVLRELLTQEMDRQGVTDEEQRKNTLDEFSRQANAELDEIRETYGKGLDDGEEEKEEEKQEDL